MIPIKPDILIRRDTMQEARFEDTNKLFEVPRKVDFHIKEWNEKNHIEIAEKILKNV